MNTGSIARLQNDLKKRVKENKNKGQQTGNT